MKLQARSVAFGHALLAIGTALWPRALADAATVSMTSAASATARFVSEDDCQNESLVVQLQVDVSTPATGPVTRVSTSSVSLTRSNWCNGTSRSFFANWNDVSSMRVSDAAQSASVSLARTVNLTECSYADGVPNCSERSVPLTLSVDWTARGQVTTNTSYRQNNLSGVVQRSFDADKLAAALLNASFALDGAVLSFGSNIASLSARLSRQAEATP